MAQLIPNPAPVRVLEGHKHTVTAVAVFPDRRRTVTGSKDRMVRLWDMKEGVVLKKLEGHHSAVNALAVSRDGQLIASGDQSGELIVWNVTDVGEYLTQTIDINAHTNWINTVDFSPDCSMLATGSFDETTKLWSTKTWELQVNAIECGDWVRCVRYSPSGELLAITTDRNIKIYNPTTRECIANFKGHTAYNLSLAWTPDGSRLLSGGNGSDPTIREWDASTWKEVGDPWMGHTEGITAIAANSAGTLVASASRDNHIRLWRLADRRTITVFKHSGEVNCVTFSAEGGHILGGGVDKKISEWPLHNLDNLPEDGPEDGPKELEIHQAQASSNFKVFSINATARNACITGDLPAVEELLTKEIDADANNYTSYANRAFVMARKCDWDHALHDAIQSVSIQPSLAGHISKGIALCGKKQVRAARISFDLASMFTDGDLKTDLLLLLIKATALFNANEHEEAILLVEELAFSPSTDRVACRIVETYLRVRLGNIAFDDARYNAAVDHFTAAVNASAFFYESPIHLTYEEFVVLFGWDLQCLWQTANQKQCHALFRAGRFGAAIESYQSIMGKINGNSKASVRAWFTTLK